MTTSGRRLRIRGWQAVLALAFAAAGFIVTVQVRAGASTSAYSSLERPALIQTVEDLQGERDRLGSEIETARSETRAAQSQADERQTELIELDQQLAQARVEAGLTPVEGPGGYIYLVDGQRRSGDTGQADDYRIDARDVRTLVDGLWRAGAGAVAVGKERVVGSTSIVDVDGAVRVNSAHVADATGRYVVSFIGPADVWARLSSMDTFRAWMEARYGPYHLTIQYSADSKVVVPGYTGNTSLRLGLPSAAPSAGR
jgi:uncharacterized protein YlxW (UPF0749 family)